MSRGIVLGFGTAIDIAVGLYEINHGVPPLEVGAKAAGGAAGALIGGIGGAYGGEWVGQQGYRAAAN